MDLNQNQSDSHDQIEEEEDEPPIDFKSSAQIKFESVLLKRFARSCLFISFVLFIGQIIVASTTCCRELERQNSSIVTGFALSFLLFLTWLSIASMFKDSVPEKLKKYLIENITNASFFGMVINIKPADSNDLLEEGGQQNQDETQEVVTTSQILLESLLHRIGNCCLILSAILFLGQIINASVNWDLEASSVLTGFGFSIFLFMSWACIDSVYGKGASEGRLNWCREQISFRFRIQSIEEMKQNMPTGWLTFFSTVYFIVGISIAICEAVILSNGNQSKKWYSGSVVAARFAYSSVLILTGLLCSFLTCSPKKRTTNFFCFLFAVASLVLASFGSSESMYYFKRGDFEPRNSEEFWAHKSRLDLNSEGNPYFLGWWTVITLAFQSFQLLIIAISAGLICICINLWFHIRVVPKSNDSDDSQRNSKYLFFIIGVVLMISGFVINVGLVLITKILTPSYFREYRNWVEDYQEYFTMPFACLSLYIGGLLCLSIASSYKVTRGLVLFLFSFAMMGSTIFCLYQSVQIYDRAFNQGFEDNGNESRIININWDCKSSSYDYDYGRSETNCPGSIFQNSTDFCLNWKSNVWKDEIGESTPSPITTTTTTTSTTDYYWHRKKNTTPSPITTISTCIPIQKKCDGILNFFNRTRDQFKTDHYDFRNGIVMMLSDEIFCPERYISVYISIFGAAGIAIILTVAIWVMTFDTLGLFGKLIAVTIKQRFSSHVPLN